MTTTTHLRRLTPTVRRAVVAKAAELRGSPQPLGGDTWEVVGSSTGAYHVTLRKDANGWLGLCECMAFRVAAGRAPEGAPVPACKHILRVRSYLRAAGQTARDRSSPVRSGEGGEDDRT